MPQEQVSDLSLSTMQLLKTVDELLAECEQKHAEAANNARHWAEATLRADGALKALRALKERQAKLISNG